MTTTADLTPPEAATSTGVPDLDWTRAKQFTGWRGRSGRLNAPVFVVEYRAVNEDGREHEWVLRSTLPGYASARWTFDAPSSLDAQPPKELQAFACNVLRTFIGKLLDQPPHGLDVLEAGERMPIGQPYLGHASTTEHRRYVKTGAGVGFDDVEARTCGCELTADHY